MSDRTSRHRQIPSDDDDEAEEHEEDDEMDEDELADGLDDLDVDDGARGRSKAKYMKVLRKVANRQSAAVTIDLNDVKEVSHLVP